MVNPRAPHGYTRHQGIVLIVTLVVLLVMGLMTTLAAGTAVLQLRMAGNAQHRVELLQWALSVSDALLSDPLSARVQGGRGYRICGPYSLGDCDEKTLTLPPGLSDGDSVIDYHLTRVGPLAGGMPYRPERDVVSAAMFDLVRQELTVTIAYSETRQGRVTLTQGLSYAVPAARQTGVFTSGGER